MVLKRWAAATLLSLAVPLVRAADEAQGLRVWTVTSPPIETKSLHREAAAAAACLAVAGFLLWRRRRPV